MCRVCGCCKAGIYADSGGVRVPICMACDQDILCGPQQAEANARAAAAQPQPAAPEPVGPTAPDVKESPMPEEYLCAGGCGEKTKSPGLKWGHKNGCKPKTSATSPRTSEAEPEAEIVDAPEVSINFTEAHLDRIWFTLAIEEKALAIQTALSAERE